MSNYFPPEAPTMAAYYPPTYAPQAYAWSAEQPEFNSAPAAAATQPWYARPRVAALAATAFVAASAAGLLGALDIAHSSAPVAMAAHSAPAPAPAQAPAPAPAPMPAPQPSTHTTRSTSHSSMSNSGYTPASHQAQPQTPPAPPQVQPDQSGQWNPPAQWNNSGNFWWNHSRDRDDRWNFWNRDRDHDHNWNFGNHGQDSDNSHSDSNQSGDSK